EIPMVIALNMYDELEDSGRKFDHKTFSELINIPIVPTVGKRGEGIPQLLEAVLKIYNETENDFVQIPYGRVLEKSIYIIERELRDNYKAQRGIRLRHVCIKLLEGDKEIIKYIDNLPNFQQILYRREKEQNYIEKQLREDSETAFTN